MAKNTELKVRITGDSASYTNQVFKATAANDAFGNSVHGVSKGLVAINGPLGGIASRFEAVRGIVSANTVGWVGLGAAITGASAVLLSSIKTYNQHEQQQLKVQQLLKTTGYAAGLSAQELQTQAEEVALSTLASVTGIQEAQGALLTFKSVQGETFTEAIELSQDMAAVFGGTAKDKALQLGKALQDPIKGINALSRSGVSFSDSQKAMIKSMVETGDKVGAQRIILEELANQVEGAGSAQAGGLAGSIDTLGQSWEKLQINLAKGTAAETATDWINGLANAFYRLGEAIEPSVKGLETQLTILENRLNSGFFGRNKDSQKSAVLKQIEEVNQALLITKARSGDLESLDTLIGKTQSKIENMKKPAEQGEKEKGISWLPEWLQPSGEGSSGGRSAKADELSKAKALSSERAFLKEMQALRDDAQKIKDESAATKKAEEAKDQAATEDKQKAAADKAKTKAQSDLQSLRKTLADKKELEQMAYLERQQAIESIAAAGAIDEAERWQLETDSFETYQQRLTEIQQAELDKRDKAKKDADANSYIQLLNSIGLGMEAETAAHEERMGKLQESLEQQRITQQQYDDIAVAMESMHGAQMAAIQAQTYGAVASHSLSAMESLGKQNSKFYKILFAAQKAAAIPSIIVDTEKAATSALASMPGPAGITLSGFIRGMGYASAGVVAGTAIAGAFENGGVVPGNSYSGDKLLAAVNSEEMILNRAQQNQLFKMANGQGGGSAKGGNNIVQVINASSGTKATTQETTDGQGNTVTQVLVHDLDSDGEVTRRLMSKFRLNPYGS
jgi:hypothetical protein